MLQGLISDGFNVELCQRQAKVTLKEHSCWSSVSSLKVRHVYIRVKTWVFSLDATELEGLDEAVYRRIEVLKHLRDGGHVDDTKNIDAILDAYRTGKHKVILG